MGYISCRACIMRVTLNLSPEPYTETTPATQRPDGLSGPSAVHHPKAHSQVRYKKGPAVKPHHHHSSPLRNHLSLRSGGGKHHCTVTNNISGSVSAATTVVSPTTLLPVRGACAVAGCEKKEAGTSAVHEPHRGLATPAHPPTPPPLPLPPLPPRTG